MAQPCALAICARNAPRADAEALGRYEKANRGSSAKERDRKARILHHHSPDQIKEQGEDSHLRKQAPKKDLCGSRERAQLKKQQLDESCLLQEANPKVQDRWAKTVCSSQNLSMHS